MQIIRDCLASLFFFFSFHFFIFKAKKTEFLVKILKISCLILKYICKKKKQPKASILKSMGSEGFLEEIKVAYFI